MPIIEVKGIPDGTPKLEQLLEDIRTAVASVAELRVSREQVTVFLDRDHVQKGLGEELCVYIIGLYRRNDRTPEVLNRLAQAIAGVLDSFARVHLPQCTCVEIPKPILVNEDDPGGIIIRVND